MKQKGLNRALSLLMAFVMVLGMLPAFTLTTFALEPTDVYGQDPNYEHGYFLGGRGDWEGGTWVREVYDWDDMDQVFEMLDTSSMFNYGYVTVKLMADLSMSAAGLANNAINMKEYSIAWGANNVVFDFNGHTLSATDSVSTTNVEYSLKSFIVMYLGAGTQLTFTDSVGGGGISFYSHRAVDKDLAALYVYSIGDRSDGSIDHSYNEDDPTAYPAKVTFNGGTYEMTAKIEKFGSGTTYIDTEFRGTVIADFVDVEINDGTFIANSEGLISDYENRDMCARELAAFGTIISNARTANAFPQSAYVDVIPFEETGHTVINGGKFISDGYAVHHFDNCYRYVGSGMVGSTIVPLDSHFHTNYPTINGGYFEGQMGFTGLTFTYSDGNSALNSRPASEIIPETALFMGIDGDGDECTDITKWDWDDLHDMKSCVVISGAAVKLNTTPEGDGDPIALSRTVKQSDTFEMSWTIPSYLEDEAVCQPVITVTRPNSSAEPKTYSKSKVTLDYSDYPNDVNVSCGLYIFVKGEGSLLQQAAYLQKDYTVDVKRVYTATDACMHCYVANGGWVWNEIVEGGTCYFMICPNDHYELTDPAALKVYVNDVLVTPDENGIYSVPNVTEDLTIYTDGTGFTGYSNLIVSANDKSVTEKLYVGDTYTFKTLDEFGASVPAGATFSGWKLGGKTYQPGDTFTVTGNTDIKITAVFTGLINIIVENGTAYADEAHTQPITAAPEDTVIYVVADEAPEGKVFGYWSQTASTPGGSGWFGSYDAAQTTYTVYYSDVVLTPVYEVLVDEIIINGMTKPVAGVAIENVDYNYKWGCSVPADSGYSLGTCYWYDLTTDENTAMSSGDVFQAGHTYRFKAKINLYGDTILPETPEGLSAVLTGVDAEDYDWSVAEFSRVYENAVLYFEFPCEEAPETGTSISGMVTSFGNESEKTTVQLFPSGSETPAFIVRLTGTHAMYSFEGVAVGTYTMKVSKANHVTREYTVVVGNSSIPLDAKIHLLGDISGDGRANAVDKKFIYNHMNDAAKTLTGYEFDVANVNGDTRVNAIDKKMIYNHMNDASKALW